jgi:hypothetical protein
MSTAVFDFTITDTRENRYSVLSDEDDERTCGQFALEFARSFGYRVGNDRFSLTRDDDTHHELANEKTPRQVGVKGGDRLLLTITGGAV